MISLKNNKSRSASALVRFLQRFGLALGIAFWTLLASAADRVTLQKVDVQSLPGDEVEVKLSFDGAPPAPVGYVIEKPARIALDLVNAKSGLDTKYHNLGMGTARSMTVVDTKERTRIIVNLADVAGYSARVEGNNLYLRIGKSQKGVVASAAAMRSESAPKVRGLTGVDFRRGDQGDGQVIIDLSQASVPVDVKQQGSKVVARFLGAKLPDRLRRRLDVTDFATSVKSIDAYNEGNDAVVVIQPTGEFEYLAYQADTRLTVSVKQLSQEAKKRDDFVFKGEKLSLNFQDIEVRSVLQLIADFTSLNLVASDTVSGRITLRLQNVPWDQALDLILKTKGLDKRTIGNVMLVAPADEIAARERLEMESSTQNEQLSPLRTEFIQISYAKASDMVSLISGVNRLLSKRGSASVDSRTNTLIVSDTAKKLDEIRDIIAKLDVPVRQVLIEARIVLASTNFSKELGVKWGVNGKTDKSSSRYVLGGSTKTVGEYWDASDGNSVGTEGFGSTLSITRPDDLFVDMGASGSAASFALGLIKRDGDMLQLELSALQSDGNAEIVSSPKVLTADKQKARIASGTQIPYLEATSSGAASVKFVNAELSLEVTPNITPDGRIGMDLLVNNDSPGEQVAATGTRAIDTNRVATNVLVEDGQTVVLGGIFKTSMVKGVSKVPFFGDIPYLGRLFRKTTTRDDKQELLIFITPKLVNEALASK